MEDNRSRLLDNADFIDCLEIVKKYLDYLDNNSFVTDKKINDLNEKSKSNYEKSQEILKDFHIVNFVEEYGKLYIEPVDNPNRIRFQVGSLINRSDDRPIIRMLQKRIDEYNKELAVVKKIEEEQRKKIEETQPREVKKIWGIFKNTKEEVNASEEYAKKIKALKSELDRIIHRVDMIELQIDSNQGVIDSINDTKRFISSLSRSDKKSILEHYELIKDLFFENEKLFKNIRKLEKSKEFVLSLNGFAELYLNEEDRQKYERLIDYINQEYAGVRVIQKKNSNKTEVLRMRDLTKKLDFGEYRDLVKLVTKQIYAGDSMSLPAKDVFKDIGMSR